MERAAHLYVSYAYAKGLIMGLYHAERPGYYLEDLSVRVSLKDGLDGHGEGRPPLTKCVGPGILVLHIPVTLRL